MRRGVVLLVAGAAAAAFAWRRRSGARERVELHYADGSMVSLTDENEDAQRLVPLAREVLAAARS